MADNKNHENLANARRKLKKFRDQNQKNLNDPANNAVQPVINGTPAHPAMNFHIMQPAFTDFPINPHMIFPKGISRTSPVVDLEEPGHLLDFSITNKSPQKSRIENHQQKTVPNTTSMPSNKTPTDVDEKSRRDIQHLQEQLEVHVQTIGILAADKTDLSAKLTQSLKQLERKQSEIDELHGRLKASRERVQELEKQIQNSTSDVQKREMAAKEFDKENDRLKLENIRQSQLIEDLKQNIRELNDKLRNRQISIDQLNHQLDESKKSNHEAAVNEQKIVELQQVIELKNKQIEQLSVSISEIQNANLQQSEQINKLIERNNILQIEYDTMKKTSEMKLSDHILTVDHDNLQQENKLLQNAVEQWSNRYEEIRTKLEEMTASLQEKDTLIGELQRAVPNSKESERLVQMSNENLQLKAQIESIAYSNRELMEQLRQLESKLLNYEKSTQIEHQQSNLTSPSSSNNGIEIQQELSARLQQSFNENADLKLRIQELEHVILQLQSETDTIGDYIRLYQEQREQLQNRYQEKDTQIEQLTQQCSQLQKKTSEFETLFIQILNLPMSNTVQADNDPSQVSDSSALSQISDDTKARLTQLIRQLGHTPMPPVVNNDATLWRTAFNGTDFHKCSTCTGSLQSV